MTIRSGPGMRVRSAGREVDMKTWPHLLHPAREMQRVSRGIRGVDHAETLPCRTIAHHFSGI